MFHRRLDGDCCPYRRRCRTRTWEGGGGRRRRRHGRVDEGGSRTMLRRRSPCRSGLGGRIVHSPDVSSSTAGRATRTTPPGRETRRGRVAPTAPHARFDGRRTDQFVGEIDYRSSSEGSTSGRRAGGSDVPPSVAGPSGDRREVADAAADERRRLAGDEASPDIGERILFELLMAVRPVAEEVVLILERLARRRLSSRLHAGSPSQWRASKACGRGPTNASKAGRRVTRSSP